MTEKEKYDALFNSILELKESTSKLEESTQRLDWYIKEMKEDTRKMKESMDRETKKMKEDTKELKRTLIWMWLTQGQIAEDMVSENFQEVLNETGESISSIQKNITVFEWKKKIAEFDIIWVNWTKVFIWETKTKLTKKHIDKFLEKTLPNFRKYLLTKRYSWLKMYWVMWARIFEDEQTKDYAMANWLYLMKEDHKGGLKIIKKSLKNVKAFA